MSATVRFAPSPTGHIHIGNTRTAIINWLYAQKTGGTFILRFDDTDQARSKQAYADAILEDLIWLGLEPDRIEYQSKRFERYDAIAAELKQRGLLYRCYETPDELERKRKRLLARGKPPVYDRTGLGLSDEEHAKLEAEGRVPHWRFKLSPRKVAWQDHVRSDQSIDLESLSDPVLIRGDGSYLYTLPSIVDDIDMGVSDIIRGEDHVANTGVQIDIFEALGGTVPRFGHHSLLTGADGKGLSKRLGSLAISSFRDAGLEPLAVLSHAALLGTSDAVEPHHDKASLISGFDFSKLSRAPARFDETELENLNAKLLHEADYALVEPALKQLGFSSGETLWHAIRGNCRILADAVDLERLVTGPVETRIAPEDKDYITQAAGLLPQGDWDTTTWKTWTDALKEASGRKGKQLFMPLRLALTGQDHGPEMAQLLPLIGCQESRKRLG